MSDFSNSSVRALFRGVVHRLPLPVRQHLSRLRKSRVTLLHELLPMPVPETIHIDPANLCNFRCSFCPTADKELLTKVGRPAGVMDYDLFARFIDQLSEMVQEHGQPLSILHLYKDGEPLLNKKLPEMATYAKKAGVAKLISTTSNGSLLKQDLALRLIDSGLDQIRISIIHVGADRYKDLTRTWSDYDRIRENLSFLYREKMRLRPGLRMVVKINDTALKEEEIAAFRRDFREIADELRIDTLMGWSLSESKDFMLGVSVNTGMDGASPLRDRQVCPEPFSRLAVNFDGQVSVCCVDWSFGTIVGDLRHQSLREVWEGEKLREFRMKHLSGKRSQIPACANCQYLQGEALSRDLDDHAERLMAVYARETVSER